MDPPRGGVSSLLGEMDGSMAGARMTGVRAPIMSSPTIATCDTAEGLAAINGADTELVIWQRAQPVALTAWLGQLARSQLPHFRVLAPLADLPRAVMAQADESGMPNDGARDLLLADITRLATAFAAIAEVDLVDVRLERISHDACWRFHRDCVDARLLTTYRGPATEWVPPPYAGDALRDQKAYQGPSEHLGIHDVAVFKGSCAGPGRGIVHRSPPIAGTGQTRLLLVLNKQSAASPKPWTQAAAST